MRILFLTHYFPPEVNAPANRTYEHCREWVAAGHEVHVITCIPSHPLGKPFAGYRRQWYLREEVDGINVHRVGTYFAPNRGVVRRTLNYLSLIPTALFRAWRLGRFDVVIGTSPQFFCAVAAWLYARSRRASWVFELRDLWPDSIAAVGAIRKSAALRAMQALELRLYRDASAIVCVTRAFMKILGDRGVDRGKLHFVPNGIVPAFWHSGDRAARREALGIDDADVLVSYVGTIGMAHGLRMVLDAASRLRESAPEVRLLIVGDGAELNELRMSAAQRGLTNVRFTGLVPRSSIPSILAASDIALVTLKPSDVFKTVLPSKMFEAMAARRPIVLAVDGEARETLERAGAGLAVTPGDPDDLASAVVRLVRDPALRTRMGDAGGRFVEREFSRSVWATRYLAVLESVSSPATLEIQPMVGHSTPSRRVQL
jgi:glycosyltransferase involved in cell wall biosynthesis